MGRHRTCHPEIVELAGQGKTRKEISAITGVAYTTVCSYCKANVVDVASGYGVPTDRNQRMVGMYQQGVTLEKIGLQFGLTRERVRQIIKSLGVTRLDGGKHHACLLKKSTRVDSFNIKCLTKYGLPAAEVRPLIKQGVVAAFSSQKHMAAARGIEWRLSLGEWLGIWTASEKFHLRGRGRGKYVMSRIVDDGPYAVGNVHIELSTVNNSDGLKGRTKRPEGKTGVYHLYPGLERGWVAKVGRMVVGHYATEDAAIAARTHVLEGRA